MIAGQGTEGNSAGFDRERELFLDAAISEKQVEAEYGLTMAFLRAKRLHGGGPDYAKVGRSVKYQRRAILAYLKANTARPSAASTGQASP
jgi:hypothetical protein